MAAERTRFTTDQVVSFFFDDESSSEDGENVEETFTEYVGIALSDPEEESVDTDLLSTKNVSACEDSDDNGQIPSPTPTQTGCSTTSVLVQDTALDPVVESADTSADSGESIIFDCDSDESDTGSQDSGSECGSDGHGSLSGSPVEYDATCISDNDSGGSIPCVQGGNSEAGTIGQARGHGYRSRRQTRGRGRGQRGQSRFRVRGQRGLSRGRGRGHRLRGQSQSQGRLAGRRTTRRRTRAIYTALIPEQAKPISEPDIAFSAWSDFQPLREPGPHLPFPEDHNPTELDLFRLFITDDIVDRLVQATNSYAESRKDAKKSTYQRFKRSILSREEMYRFIGALLLLSISSVRNYRQAWDIKSSQVCVHGYFHSNSYKCHTLFTFIFINL